MRQLSNNLRKRKRIRLPPSDYHVQGAWYYITICCRQMKSILQSNAKRDAIVNVLMETAGMHDVELAAYCVLPNHLHFVCSAGKNGLVDFIRVFKGRATKRLRERFGLNSPWQASFFDHRIRNEESLAEKCRYVWNNPVRLGLCASMNEYAWNGAARGDGRWQGALHEAGRKSK